MLTHIAHYPDRTAAQVGVKAYLNAYHPAGYGTTWTAVAWTDGSWTVKFTRANSAD